MVMFFSSVLMIFLLCLFLGDGLIGLLVGFLDMSVDGFLFLMLMVWYVYCVKVRLCSVGFWWLGVLLLIGCEGWCSVMLWVVILIVWLVGLVLM